MTIWRDYLCAVVVETFVGTQTREQRGDDGCGAASDIGQPSA